MELDEWLDVWEDVLEHLSLGDALRLRETCRGLKMVIDLQQTVFQQLRGGDHAAGLIPDGYTVAPADHQLHPNRFFHIGGGACAEWDNEDPAEVGPEWWVKQEPGLPATT